MYSGTHRCFVLVQNLIVFAHRDAEDDRRHILEAMNPLFTLRPLTAHVEQPEICNSNMARNTRVRALVQRSKSVAKTTYRYRFL